MTFTLKKPESFNFVRDVLDVQAEKNGELTALYWVGQDSAVEKYSFSDMSMRSQKAANVLKSFGLERGDLVILVIGKIPAWWDVYSACIRLGLVISPAPTSISASDLDYRIQASGAKAIVAQTHLAENYKDAENLASLKVRLTVGQTTVENWSSYSAAYIDADSSCAAVDTAADEDSICYFTSGTTGYPKMTIHSHASYGIGHEVTGRFWLNLKPGVINWSMSDTGWAKAGWGCYYAPWRQGAGIFIPEMPKFGVAETLFLLENHPIHTFCAPPTVYRMLIQNNIDGSKMSHLKYCVSAGEPLNPEAMKSWHDATGMNIHEGYGQTETTILCGIQDGMDVRPGSMGKPMPGYVVDIVSDDGTVMGEGEEGNIAVKLVPTPPVGLFKAYKNDAVKTAGVKRGDWYYTGDKGYKDKDGYFWFVSRADDVIISAGYRIGPFEVENVIQEHASVLECAVIGVPDNVRGEVIKAFIILADGFEGSEGLVKEIQNHVKSETAPYKYPRQIEFVTELPKTISGKVRRVELRARD